MAFRAFIFGYNTLGLSFVEKDLSIVENILAFYNYNITKGSSFDKVKNEISTFCDNLSKSDTAFFYFSGHSIVRERKFYLVLDSNVNAKFASSTYLIDTLISSIETSTALNKILILDCCRSALSGELYKPNWTNRLKILCSSDINTSSKEIDNFKSSLLAYFLNQALIQDVDIITNTSQEVRIYQLFKYLENEINKYNQENNESFSTPKLHGEASLDFPIVINDNIGRSYLHNINECLNNCKGICHLQKEWCNIVRDSPVKSGEYVVPKVRFSENNINTKTELLSSLISIFENKDKKNMLLLGDSGIGKSISCIYLIGELLKKTLSKSTQFYPLFFSLDSLVKKDLFGKDILKTINAVHNLSWSNKDIEYIKNNYTLVFFLDGFDELSERSEHGKILANLRKIEPFYLEGSIVVLTCRTHYFSSDEQINEVILGQILKGTDLFIQLNKTKNHLVLQLQEFEKKEIDEYIRLKFKEESDVIIKQIESIYNLLDLSKRPLLLKLIADTLPQLIKMKKEINRIILYQIYTRHWLLREAERKESNISIDQKTTFISYLAISMWENQTLSMSYNELQDILRSKYGKELFSEASFHSADYDTRNSSFLNRNELGYYKFMHKSFMEYFIGLKCVKEIRKDGKQMESWKLRWFDKEVAQFICELLMNEVYNDKIASLVSSALSSNHSILIWNTLHITSLLDKDVFMKNVESNILFSFEKKADIETNSVLLRQYCRIIAKFDKREKAEKLLEKLIVIVKNNSIENMYNNQTYINYYYGLNSACEALLNHLSPVFSKYDRLLHLHVLGEIGNHEHIERLKDIIQGWKDKKYINEAYDIIRKLESK